VPVTRLISRKSKSGEKLLACRAEARWHDVEPAHLRAQRFGAAAFVLASLRAKAGGR